MAIEARGARTPRKSPRKPRWRSNLLLSLTILILLATGIAFWTTQNYLWRIASPSNHSTPRALIADQLSLNYPDPSFVTNTTQALTAGGYAVDYEGPSANAIDMFRQLPTQGYDLIIIRAHQGGGQSIITTQPYSQSQYVADQLTGALATAEVEGGPLYFAITPRFVRQEMQGRFPGSTIVIMGCAALQGTQDLATAFLDKGANFFVGWDGSVTIIHTDTSTVSLVQQVSAGRSVPEATRIAGSADPVYGARLEYLDWNSLVQGRIDNLVSQAALWSLLGAVLVLGPLAVFAAPKLFDLLDRIGGRTSRRKNHNPASKDPPR